MHHRYAPTLTGDLLYLRMSGTDPIQVPRHVAHADGCFIGKDDSRISFRTAQFEFASFLTENQHVKLWPGGAGNKQPKAD